ncbi:MAG: sugar ABC transporter substrate-binding protein, partial [Spirochaetaceae bacterium]|nr:sugar ABC transporter substrate-binding protein [Spirochaetaceae bacterium]
MKKVLFLTVLWVMVSAVIFAGGGSQQASGAGPVKLTYWEMNWGPADMQKAATDKLVKKFNDSHPNIQVEVQYIPWDNYYQTFLTAVTSGNAPDVATGATPQPIQYAVMGESLDLDPVMEAWRQENNPILTDITPDLWKFFQYQGKQYGIAFGLDLKLFLYRKDFFQQAGITTMPKTWPEFTAVLEKLKVVFPDKIPLLMPAGDQNSNHSFSMFLGSNHAGFTTHDLKPAFRSKATMECLNYIKELYDKQLLGRGAAGYIGSDVERMFAAGEACILGGWGFSAVAGKDIEKNCAIMPPITGPSARQGSMVYCPNGIMGFSQTRHPDATRTFIKWWMENYLDMISESGQGNFPARR